MSFSSIGDLASSLLLNRSGIEARRSIDTLSKELTTGLKSDVTAAVRGDYSGVADWEARISQGLVREKTLSEGLSRASVKGEVLDTASQSLTQLANDIDLIGASGQPQGIRQVSGAATGALEDFVNRLNTRVAGQSVFSGTATDQPAFARSSDILASAKAALSGALTVTEIDTRLNNWMNDAVAGFPAIAYLGNSDDGPSVRLSANAAIGIPGRGDDDAIKFALRDLIQVSLATDADLAFTDQVQNLVLKGASVDMRNGSAQLIDLQARIGYTESRLEGAKAATSAEIASARQMRLSSLAADPYETATRLQNAELQLEKIYALTARSAGMSLMEYLR